ncbi:MAG: shikimate dehydrogenase [Gemmatimonadota bacterium]|nr:shikimate dehydrogenase [Gemmatimonadota bacterium]
MTPTTETRLLVLLGDPVHHSLSPVFQNAALRAAGLDAAYLALRCDSASLAGLLRGIALSGGGGNVTLPHKEQAAGCVDRATPLVERTGACNTFWAEGGVVWGDNTDVAGVTAAVHSLLGGPPSGARVLLLGAGGAARAALCALLDGGAERVVVHNRSPGRAEELLRRCAVGDGRARVGTPWDGPWDLVVNATSQGIRAEDPFPLELRDPLPGAVLDLVYARGNTPWIREAHARGVPAEDGSGVLIAQGAAAWERWWGRPAPMEEMRRALAG